MAKRKAASSGGDFSAIIKIDGTTKAGAQHVLSGAINAARKHAPGARGTFVIAPTKSLGAGPVMRKLSPGTQEPDPRPQRTSCKATKNNGERCSFPAADGNYGFCNRHR